MTKGLVSKLKVLLEEAKKQKGNERINESQEMTELIRLISEIEDFWNGRRVSRFRVPELMEKIS